MKSLPKPAPGKRGKKRDPDAVEAGREHIWETRTARGQPGWLNDNGGTKRVCQVCGVEDATPSFILADHAGFGSEGRALLKGKRQQELFYYVDAKGRTFSSAKALGCPTFLVDEMGAIRENREMLREVDDRVDYTDDRVDDVEERVESVEERLARLEAENVQMKARLEERVDVTALVDWLSDMVAVHAAQKLATVQVQIEGRPVAALPPPVADLIVNIGAVTETVRVGGSKAQPQPVVVDMEDDD